MKKLEFTKRGDMVKTGRFGVALYGKRVLFRRGEVVRDRHGFFWVPDKFQQGKVYEFYDVLLKGKNSEPIYAVLLEKTPKKVVFRVISAEEAEAVEMNAGQTNDVPLPGRELLRAIKLLKALDAEIRRTVPKLAEAGAGKEAVLVVKKLREVVE